MVKGPAETVVRGACPLDCPDTCGWTVTVRDGTAVALRGDRDHPFTRGALCVKVNNYLEHTTAPDRLLHPLRRVGRKGEGRFERITWDEALNEIAERLTGVIDEHGGESIWPYYGTGTMGYVQGLGGGAFARFWNVLGASRHDPYGICSKAGGTGLTYTVGTSGGMDPEEIQHARLIMLWGTNTLTSGHHLWKFVQAAQREGAHVVAIDPIRTRTAEQADEHIAPIPGTDAALALGLLHVVVEMGAQDREYLAAHTVGWDAFREEIRQCPPARVAAITGLPEATIVALGERLARTRPTAIRATMGLQRHAGGGMALRTLACIPGVTGDWGRVGGGLTYSTGAWFPLNTAAVERDDLRARPARTLLMTRLAEGLLDRSDPPVHALFVIAANPAASVADQNRVRRGLAREDLFTVVMEQFPTETVDYADIVLPSTMQTEHADLHAGWGHFYLSWNEPAVAPPGECLPTTETLRRLAERMKLDEPCIADTDEEMGRQLLDGSGIDFDELRARGWARIERPRPFSDGFPTPSGKLEFTSERAAADGHGLLPGFTPSAEVDDPGLAARFPLVLIAGASHYFLNTVFGNDPRQQRRAGGPRIRLHPTDAAARGISDGQPVRIFNDRGEFTATAEITDRVRPGVVATTKGHWPKLLGGDGVNATVDERDTDMGGGAVFHDNRVQVA
ncbi:molybdopterin-containing oxidoreductase family protein [Pseudonocardia sp. TRM90224]|uniref:molybdopterin-containing oxidoreductase family protein n=1 Tax=Pseudonocardia sp. TRM90224 TaxID=2812678 RepID=UPI001E4FA88B|nr:molybdopterin oxidoreductase family protein [Pseudonocardia sp. TRM90224]